MTSSSASLTLSLGLAVLWSSAALGHEDRIFAITPGGHIADIPAPWGPVQLSVSYSEPGRIASVELEGRHFRSRLPACVLVHLDHVQRIAASGSWWHERGDMPAYVSLEFIREESASAAPLKESVTITFSLEDGRVLMGQRTHDPWWGRPRAEVVQHADSCSGWTSP